MSNLTYKDTGVDTSVEESCMKSVKEWAKSTFFFNRDSKVMLDIGYFANVIDIGNNIGIAISTDGVGTKVKVAEYFRKFDTIGIDLIASNANDVLCVGARPISLVDYVAVQKISKEFLVEIGKGIREGARLAGISIPAGEIAQVNELLSGFYNNESGFDLVGTCIGIVPVSKINTGSGLLEGNVVIGLESSGLHCNGYTLARKALFLPDYVETLLTPTKIYVDEVFKLLDNGINILGMAHITSDGLTNLSRMAAFDVGFNIDNLPTPQPIFQAIQQHGKITDEEMFTVFNMGIGFCVVVPAKEVSRAMSLLEAMNVKAHKIGKVISDKQKRVYIPQYNLVGEGNEFVKN